MKLSPGTRNRSGSFVTSCVYECLLEAQWSSDSLHLWIHTLILLPPWSTIEPDFHRCGHSASRIRISLLCSCCWIRWQTSSDLVSLQSRELWADNGLEGTVSISYFKEREMWWRSFCLKLQIFECWRFSDTDSVDFNVSWSENSYSFMLTFSGLFIILRSARSFLLQADK